jgi:hypothetical protein
VVARRRGYWTGSTEISSIWKSSHLLRASGETETCSVFPPCQDLVSNGLRHRHGCRPSRPSSAPRRPSAHPKAGRCRRPPTKAKMPKNNLTTTRADSSSRSRHRRRCRSMAAPSFFTGQISTSVFSVQTEMSAACSLIPDLDSLSTMEFPCLDSRHGSTEKMQSRWDMRALAQAGPVAPDFSNCCLKSRTAWNWAN